MKKIRPFDTYLYNKIGLEKQNKLNLDSTLFGRLSLRRSRPSSYLLYKTKVTKNAIATQDQHKDVAKCCQALCFFCCDDISMQEP